MKPIAIAAGTRVHCIAMIDPQAVPAGMLGTAVGCTAMGVWLRIGVDWDNGSYLAVTVPLDRPSPNPLSGRPPA